MKGTLSLQYLPDCIERFSVQNNELHGSVETACLPQKLVGLTLNAAFDGPFDCSALPPALTAVDIRNNDFCGSADLTELPSKLAAMDLQGNKFAGGVDLSHLPESLLNLSLRNNNFSGSLSVKHLPFNMESIDVSINGFSGELELDAAFLSPQLKSIAIYNNDFRGRVRMYKLPLSLLVAFTKPEGVTVPRQTCIDPAKNINRDLKLVF